MSAASSDGAEALRRLASSAPAAYLSPSTELSQLARSASVHLFDSLLPYFPGGRPPLDRLLAGDSFDAEQVWAQVDGISEPILSLLRRQLRKKPRKILEKESDALPNVVRAGDEENGIENVEVDEDDDGLDEKGEEDDENLDEEEEKGEDDLDKAGEEGDDEDVEEEANGDGETSSAVEDKFFKIKELEEFLENGEAAELGVKQSRKSRNYDGDEDEDEDEDVDEEEGEDEEDDEDPSEEEDDIEELNDLDDDNEEGNDMEDARYEDFFGGKGRKMLEKPTSGDLHDTIDVEQTDGIKDGKILSTHEKELLKKAAQIARMEKANMDQKSWTMIGEVTAAKRPKDSLIVENLEFERNRGPAPIITEEVTASIEDLIKKRIQEGHFDDVQRAPILSSKAPREVKELDENKSKKGLAEIYEEEYAQKTGLAPTALSTSDELKKEATDLFKLLCLRLDALSHFHFAPKPVIADMSIQANVPALAMEEIAPVAVSDAAMLAPEEIFEGKGNVKAESELTQAERKRRRANKKRRFKARKEKQEAKRPRKDAVLDRSSGK